MPDGNGISNLAKNGRASRLRTLLRSMKHSRWMRLLPEMRMFGYVGPGFNVIPQTSTAALLDLIERLRPQDCGKKLIRIGGAGDGGYLIPDDLEGIEYCFSPGVSNLSNFEDRLAELKIKSFLADYSVDAPPVLRPEFTFDKKYLGPSNSERFFTLASWKQKYLKDYKSDLILQMDIEGSEYPVILNASDELLAQFRIAIIEFHWLERLFDPLFFDLFSACFTKLLATFHVVHIHPNNYYNCVKRDGVEVPRIMEFTFLNKRRAVSTTPVRALPHELDMPNASHRKDRSLPACWYGTGHNYSET